MAADDEKAGGLGDPLALDLARARAEAAAGEYIQRQTVLADRQLVHAEEEQALKLAALRGERWSLRLKLATQGLTLAALALVALAVAALVWTASRDRSLVVEPFRTPPDLAARGVDGAVVATQLMDRLGAMDASSQSFRASSTYANSWSGDIKVEIPQTGVSIGELQKLLRGWLGHQTHITGEIVRTAPGKLVLTVRTTSRSAVLIPGDDADLGGLIAKAAEAVHGATQPYQYSKWLEYHGRPVEALAVARKEAVEGPAGERPWAWTQIDNLLMASGDFVDARIAGLKALALDPDLTLSVLNMSTTEGALGHDEEALRLQRRLVRAFDRHAVADLSPMARESVPVTNRGGLASLVGDYRSAAAAFAASADLADFQGSAAIANRVVADELARGHDTAGSRCLRARMPDPDVDARSVDGLAFSGADLSPQFFERIEVGDWAGAAALERRVIAAAQTQPLDTTVLRERFLASHLADALARGGDLAGARAVLAPLPADCDGCLRARARTEALARNDREAERLFAILAARGPSIPFNWRDRGEARLARGDAAGAEADARRALKAGPHYAEAADLLGRARLAQGDAGGAAAALRRALADAPGWGAAHVHLADALRRAGRAAEAAAAARAALALDLAPADRARAAALAHG